MVSLSREMSRVIPKTDINVYINILLLEGLSIKYVTVQLALYSCDELISRGVFHIQMFMKYSVIRAS